MSREHERVNGRRDSVFSRPTLRPIRSAPILLFELKLYRSCSTGYEQKDCTKVCRCYVRPTGQKQSTTQDELRKLQETTATLEDEAQKAALNLAGYRFQSRLTVFAYWCCDRRQRERKALLMSRWVEPIEEEYGRCRTEVILDEADAQPQRNRWMTRQLRPL